MSFGLVFKKLNINSNIFKLLITALFIRLKIYKKIF